VKFRIPRFAVCVFGVLFLLTICFDFSCGQNIVGLSSTKFTANPVTLTEMDFSEFFYFTPELRSPSDQPENQRVVRKLEAHVVEFLAGHPWMPFHHTLGISGYESYFNHPNEMFYVLGIALPFLSHGTAEKVKRVLADQLQQAPPYALDGFEHRSGNARESYQVPSTLRLAGRGRANSAYGVYVFWSYCHYAGDSVAARSHWNAIKARMKLLLEDDYPFDINKKDYPNDEAEKLNGDLAGLLGLFRLARINDDDAAAKQAEARARQLLELRVNLERVNPKILQKTRSATKQLHNFKLPRYCDLVPEIGEALRKLSAGCGAGHLKAFREERNGWHLAFGDRMIGGENYTNPLHFPRSLFAGVVFVEQLPADQILAFIDVPWCKGDFYFMEQCAYALWASAGRPWQKVL